MLEHLGQGSRVAFFIGLGQCYLCQSMWRVYCGILFIIRGVVCEGSRGNVV